MHYRRISGRKNWNSYVLRYGRCVAYQEWWHQQPDGDALLQARLHYVAPASWRQVRQETRDLPSRTAQPLSFSPSATGLSRYFRNTLETSRMYAGIAPIVYIALVHLCLFLPTCYKVIQYRMNIQELLDPKSWAERTFGSAQLHDMRRTRRAVQAATNLAENPLGSLPAQMQTWKATKALYRLLDEPDVTFAALMQPHLQQTRAQALSSPVVLLVQDTTDIDLSHRRKISGVEQIGNERGRGFFVQTVLAVRPQTREVLGCMAQEPFMRIPAPAGEQRSQRRKREERESDVWIRQVQAIGTPESGSRWVHVGDPRADMFPFFQACQATQTHFLVRAAQNQACPAGRRRDHLFADAGTVLAEPDEPSVRGSRPTWAPSAFDAPVACLWADDALATAS